MASFLPGIAQCTVNNFNDFFSMRHFLVKKHWGELFDCIKRLLVFRGDNLLRLVMVMMQLFALASFLPGTTEYTLMIFCHQDFSDLL